MEEKQHPVFALSLPVSRENSDSSLMYGVNTTTPGTAKGKYKDNSHGEGSAYSPSSQSRQKRISPKQSVT